MEVTNDFSAERSEKDSFEGATITEQAILTEEEKLRSSNEWSAESQSLLSKTTPVASKELNRREVEVGLAEEHFSEFQESQVACAEPPSTQRKEPEDKRKGENFCKRTRKNTVKDKAISVKSKLIL